MTEPNNLDPLILDGQAIARDLGINPGTIRNWAAAGLIARHGSDERGRSLYDFDEVAAHQKLTRAGTPAPRRTDGLSTATRIAGLLDRSPDTIRNWAKHGYITEHGSDQGQRLYDLDEAKAYNATLVRRVTSDEVATPRRAPNTCRRLPTDWWPGKA